MMDIYNDLEQMCETLGKALKEANRKLEASGGKLTGDDLAFADKLTHAIKSVKTTMAMMDSEGGYSNNGGGSYGDYPMGGSYRGGGSYDGGSYNGGSYARGRTNARRDSSGRYSRNGYSRDDGEDMIEKLREVMEDAPDQLRQDIQRLISKAEQM